MLKNYLIAAVAGLVLMLPVLASAADMRIGFVNVAKLLDQAPQSEDASQRLKAEFEPRQEKIVAVQRKLREQEERLLRDGDVMSGDERQKLERAIKDDLRELKRMDTEFKEDYGDRQREEMNKVQDVFMNAIRKLAEDEKYDLILTEGVAYVSPKSDVTDLLLKRLGK